MAINGKNSEAPNSDERGPGKINGKDDSPTYGFGPKDIGPEPGIFWIQPKDGEYLRCWINEVITGKSVPGKEGCEMFMELEPEAAAKGWTCIRIVCGKYRYNAVIHGWTPTFRTDAHGLLAKVEAAFQSWVRVSDAGIALKCARSQTLLTDARLEAMKLLQDAEAESDSILVPIMEAIQSPANWADTIPDGTLVAGLWYGVLEEAATK